MNQQLINIKYDLNINQPNNMIKSTIKLIKSTGMSQEICQPLDHTPVNPYHTFKNSFLQSMPIPFTN